jgi:hypothetical protein
VVSWFDFDPKMAIIFVHGERSWVRPVRWFNGNRMKKFKQQGSV